MPVGKVKETNEWILLGLESRGLNSIKNGGAAITVPGTRQHIEYMRASDWVNYDEMQSRQRIVNPRVPNKCDATTITKCNNNCTEERTPTFKSPFLEIYALSRGDNYQ